MAKRLIPLFDRVLVQKIAQKAVSNGGILLPESASASKLNSAKVIGFGPGKVSTNVNVDVCSSLHAVNPQQQYARGGGRLIQLKKLGLGIRQTYEQ